ncbi:MAG TPA: NTP transferase domain-containing protein [Acidimicrobiales bacterium]|jgi:bifunctional UDP-N-acetylglucosamine pyrophosphorylase/glucosamine-1-phosphate N-acetyltransferase|nr:NTP transferase domain-containing protein [Acidimicrobiales bacterium]
MPERPLSAVVLAAGEGTRMRSSRPKPLHMLCGRAMVLYVLDALSESEVDKAVVVVGHGAERVTKKLQEAAGDLALDFVEQHVQRGTGDATSVGLTAFLDDDDDGDVLVLPGDTPLLRASTVASLVREHRLTEAACTILTARSADATGYGRVVRGKDDRVERIVEERDATDEERAITEWNTSIYCFRRGVLAPALRRVTPDNDQGEYYLTDVVEVLHDAGYSIVPIVVPDDSEPQGINDRRQLAAAEAELRRRINDAWLGAGVTMVDPDRTYIDSTVRLAPDVTIFPGTLLQGETVIGGGVELGPDTRLVDCIVGDGAMIERTVGRHADVGAGALVGPYAVLEPGSHIASGARTGPFYTAVAEESGA